MADAPAGLRVRKKQQTREKIAATAALLFRERGYKNVRVVDIAEAAEVAEQTLYNYFPTKEHLIFDLDREFEEMVLGAVGGAKQGRALAESVRQSAREFLRQVARGADQRTGIPAAVVTGPLVRRVWVELTARVADRVAEELRRSAGRAMSKLEAKVMARAIVAVFAAILEDVGMLALTGRRSSSIVKELAPAVEAAINRLEFGLRRGPVR